MNIPILTRWADPIEDHLVTLRPQTTMRQAIVNLKAAVEARKAYHAAGSPDEDCERINHNEWSARAEVLSVFEREGIEAPLALLLPEIL